ncbi:diglucosyl diacylglycerol synthase [Bacillus lacus]|uniref:Processive diacylglycerol beta-glucosyltransferase n=1 Tax=Metabacillus lacus TaxID=1983721 RepID=A0A7X2IWU2_9BACI|nr:diglucosyl diacylglycerol synthase [Metabacillus lacus]MRX70917.1 diglucosyl diacylglycerol synthase [Metabacillus lacus]
MLRKQTKVLILTANYGNGHVQVANTMLKECQKLGMDAIICDLYSESHPITSDITQYLYLKSFSIGKQFYRLFYYGVDKIYNKRMMNLYYNMGNKRLHEIITKENPDMIINTFPMIVVPEYRRRSGKVIPTFNVMTDFCLHKIWVHENIDKYYVATNHVKEKLLRIGIPSSSVKVTGIPIRPQFEDNVSKSRIYRKYRLDPSKKVLLIMAGAHGVLKNVRELCTAFASDSNLQIVVVCGKNHLLKEALEEVASLYPQQIIPLGYVERVDELFRITDCMITKPGGITLSESAALGVPVVLYKPVPGQEKENAVFFENKGAAVVINKYEDLYDTVSALLKDERKLESMKYNISSLHKGDAASVILNDILSEAERIKIKYSMKGSVNY